MTDWRRHAATAADLLLAGILLAAPLAWGKLQASGLALVTCLLALAWVLICVAERPAFTLRLTRALPNLPVVLLLVAALASVTVSVSPVASWPEVIRLLVGVAFFLALARPPLAPRRAWLTLGALAAGATVCSWLGAREYLFERMLANNPVWRVFGVFLTPNGFAGYLIMALPACLALLLAARTTSLRLLSGTAALLAALGLFLSGSRGGQLAFLPSLALFLVLVGHALRRPRLAWGLIAAALALVLLAAVTITPLRVRVVGLLAGQDASMTFRYYVWQAAARQFAAHPLLGTGAGTFQLVYPQYTEVGFTRMAHQNYLQLAAETGLLGLLAFLGMAAAFALTLARAWRRCKEVPLRLSLAACAGGGTALLLHSLVDYGWYLGPIMLAWFALLALATNLAAGPEPAADTSPCLLVVGKTALGRLGTLLAGGLLLTLLVGYTWQLAAAESHLAAGEEAELAGSYDVARSEYQQAVDTRPRYPEALRRLARVSPPAQALLAARQALRLEPTNALNHALLARLLAREGQPGAAIAHYIAALRWNPRYPVVLRELAQLYEQQGRMKAAHRCYERLISLQAGPFGRYQALQSPETEYAYAHYWRARGILGRRKKGPADYAAAQKELEAALQPLAAAKLVPTVAQIVDAQAHGGQARLSPEAIRLEGRIHYRRAQVLAARGQKQEAEAARQQARQLFPGVEQAVAAERRFTL